MANRPKSFETVLEEERREVLALLEKRPSRRPKRAGSSTNPRRASSPLRMSQRPVRSMLDIGNGSASTQPPTARTSTEGLQEVSTRSMLDIDSSESADASETETSANGPSKGSHLHHRSLSDTTFRPADLHSLDADFILSSAYKLSGYLSSNTGPPKRNTQAGKVTKNSSSPRSSITPDPNKLVFSDGRAVDKSSAYRRLSDSNLATPGHRSSISSSGNSSGRASSGDATKPGRPILKNHNATPEDEEAVAESSEEDGGSSDEERHRGRKKEPRDVGQSEGKPLTVRVSKGPKSALGRAAAAERDGTLWPL